MKYNNKRAFLFLELLIAVALISTVFVTLFFLQSKLLQIKQDGIMKVRATYYAQEAFEALRYLRATSGWSAISTPTTDTTGYYAVFENNTWSLTTEPPAALDGIFTRTIQFGAVQRQDSNQGVIDPGGVFTDSDTRKVTVTVSWDGGAKSVVLDTYLTNWTSLL